MFARLRPLLWLYLILMFAGASGAEAAEWKKHRYAADNFEVEFSGEVTVRETTLPEEAKKQFERAMDYMQDGDEFVYIVSVQLLNKDLQPNLTKGSTASFAALKCVNTTVDKSIPLPGGTGRELEGMDCVDGSARAGARYYIKRNWFYQVVYMIKKEGGDLKGAKRFLNSFKVISSPPQSAPTAPQQSAPSAPQLSAPNTPRQSAPSATPEAPSGRP